MKKEGFPVRLTYDPRYNVAYIRLNEKTGEVETIHVNEELSIDLAPDGTIYGIELLNTNEQLMPTPNGKLAVVNGERGQAAQVDPPSANLLFLPPSKLGASTGGLL